MPDIHMNKKPCRILLVDDEKDVIWPITYSLRGEGYEVLTACDGAQALASARRHRFDLIILDIVMPGMDGFRVCRELRESHISGAVPILFMTGRSDVDDRVRGLDEGGDDYLVKPFAMKELQARVRALLRRSRSEPKETEDSEHQKLVLEAGPITLSVGTREVRVGNTTAKLTPKELDLLHYLMLHFDEILSSKELLQQVWGYPAESNSTSVVRWHIKFLREKIEPIPSHPTYLRTVPHHGYVLGTND